MEQNVPPVRKQITVVMPVADAFALFTEGVSRWWPLASHSCFQREADRVHIEPRTGGAIVEHAKDGRTADWGKVLEWEPPHRFAMTWYPATDPSQATHVEVAFADEGGGHTVVTLVHSGWEARGETARAARDDYDNGWVGVLGSFVDFSAQRPVAAP